ncbi:MAG: phosphoribosylanthranilate isomerase [Proteobacteria bacterium]|nr:phosphoribosylanthranilate isomerase [Desulfobulbaceae bacterium]MBU4153944.1 phosphoribosylanthranilate isomerase [Pseudomonadota bacterium]
MSGEVVVPRRTRVKICGITDQVEAQAIVAMGVDALGFIFVKSSPRYVEPERVRAIVASLPPFVDAVGVFLDDDVVVVNEVAGYCGLTMIQLHGNESPLYCQSIDRPVVKAFRVREEALPDFSPYRQVVTGFLLDTYRPGQAGGTGETFNWELVRRLSIPGPLILAGGLTPDNVCVAIHQAHPFAVDVNSGVEVSPGRKDLSAVGRLLVKIAGL